ncbi:MAG: hypothetical protein HC921_20005 [Synechococcaceae cyanobacterium SM2_3_1]|nr:hypothetical protein [Synechococcaceae cyanobacterium SM2_3_1]
MADLRTSPTTGPSGDAITIKRMEALKRGGVHRLKGDQPLPTTVHYVGIGKVGAEFITQAIQEAPSDFLLGDNKQFTAFALDIGDQHLAKVREAAGTLPAEKAQVRTLALEVPTREALFASLRRYREFLKLEFPRYYWNPNYEPWLPEDITIPAAGEEFPRALAKAIYGISYYEEPKTLAQELELFAKKVDSLRSQTVVCLVFGLGEGVGSGISVDLARHLTNVCFGRRALVLGIGVLPPGDEANPSLFPTLNEIDCMLDQEKNKGVLQVWGDLYRDPFTAGFLVVNPKAAFEKSQDKAAAQKQVFSELSSFLMDNQSVDLYETLRLLNWVGASPTQHAAARSQYGRQWCQLFGYLDTGANVETLPQQLGLMSESFHPNYFELRSTGAASADTLSDYASRMSKVFTPLVEPEVIQSEGGSRTSAQFVLPGARKTDLEVFFKSRDVYDQLSWDEKLLAHSSLLELGVLLSEPAIRFEGMAGECLWGCACWVVVPYDQIRGDDAAIDSLRKQLEQVVQA